MDMVLFGFVDFNPIEEPSVRVSSSELQTEMAKAIL
jgi:hypothetical protein